MLLSVLYTAIGSFIMYIAYCGAVKVAEWRDND